MKARTTIAGLLICALLAPASSMADTPAKPAPVKPTSAKAGALNASGAVKAYKGPEGALIVMVPVNESKEMLVHFKKVDGALNGKTLRYLLEDQGRGNKTVYLTRKRGSKTHRAVVLISRDFHWTLYYPGDAETTWSLAYSESESANITFEDVLAAYKQ